MLRSLYSGISGLRAHQTMLDVTGNNIANVNTQGFKSSSVQFQDTLSQVTKSASSPQATAGGTNAAQVGLGVQVAGIATNFAQGSTQATGKSTDMMISGDGFFITKHGGDTLYTRAGAMNPDAQGRLVTPDGGILQGWMASPDGTVGTGAPVSDIVLSAGTTVPAAATGKATAGGNLPADGAGSPLTRDIQVYDALGNVSNIAMTFTHSTATGNSWTVSAPGSPATTLTFDAQGNLPANTTMTAAGVTVDLSTVTGFAGLSTVTAKADDGRAAGTLKSYSVSQDGTIVGSFSNGITQSVGQVALATFTNPGGLEKAGNSSYSVTSNSGAATTGTAGSAGMGTLASGVLEMSNVDLSQEFTNLIVAQRGFQANARIITTSDEVLQELTNLKR
ncbi:flagellar hook protein FlgE [Paeniglutamicibacter antarcticus]|uniref:Flagellar hook protein FlgE n=1 Tax=Arthrobacter terrae TaxID=2935737 RepID=A0A931CNU4_9MICC|nr:flagellar hook protein FlgE [Arthrobacter terrae]MBG0740297.1 flagellar hook protein FlgE [Arthrobacter terrae]